MPEEAARDSCLVSPEIPLSRGDPHGLQSSPTCPRAEEDGLGCQRASQHQKIKQGMGAHSRAVIAQSGSHQLKTEGAESANEPHSQPRCRSASRSQKRISQYP